MNADVQLDPEGEDLPWNWVVEICAITDDAPRRPLRETAEERGILAKELANITRTSEATQETPEDEDDPTIFESISNGPELRKHIEKATDFLKRVRIGYAKDPLFSKVMDNKSHYPSFECRDGLLYTRNCGKDKVLCIPRVITRDYSLTAIVIEQGHTILGHFSAQKTADYIRRWYWWPRITQEVNKYCDSCSICQANKTSTQRPVGLLHPLTIPNWPWGSIGMDFISPSPKSQGTRLTCLLKSLTS